MRDSERSALTPSRRNSARQRRALQVGFALSAILHAALLFGWRTEVPADAGSLAAGPRSGDARAAEGGGAMTALAIAQPRPIEVPAPPIDRPRLTEPEITTRQPQEQVLAASLEGPRGSLAEGRTGAGLPGADGAGDGGSDYEGRDRSAPPTPRSIIPRWDPPRELRGQRVTLRVQIDATGEPTGAIEIQPRIADTGFERQLRKDLLAMDFLPGRRDGRPIVDWAELTLTF